MLNTSRPRQDGRHFPDDIFKWIFLNENVWISINISLKFVPRVPINNIPTLVQVMAWRRSGDKPLSESMMFTLLMHICITRPQWINGAKRRTSSKLWIATGPLSRESTRNTNRADFSFAPSQWETPLLCNDVSLAGSKPWQLSTPRVTQHSVMWKVFPCHDIIMINGSADQAPVPLSIFRSNSKFDENSERSIFEYTRPITTIFCTRHDSDTVVTCEKYRCDRPRIFYTRVFWIFIEFRIRSKYA